MEIIIRNRKVETTEICAIKSMYEINPQWINREAGFVVYLIDKSPLVFRQDIPYSSTRGDISEYHDKWKRLKDEITKQWEQDKNNIKTFDL